MNENDFNEVESKRNLNVKYNKERKSKKYVQMTHIFKEILN